MREAPDLPGAREFLSVYEVVESAEAAHFTRIWRDPAAYHWVRRAVHLLAALHGAPLPEWERAYCAALGAGDPAEALAIHLAQFGKFVLALGVVAHREVRLAVPYEAVLPIAIPGTDVVLSGDGRAGFLAVAGGRIEIELDGARRWLSPSAAAMRGEPRAEICPSVAAAGARVLLNPYLFRLPGIGFFREPGDDALEFQRRHAALVGEALLALQRLQPSTFSHFVRDTRVVALKLAREEDFGTLSTSELPGAFVCSVPADPLALAADFIHELHHDRLFSIEEAGPFFEPGAEDAVEGELHYSPWRDAPRPLHGLLHAVYVYVPVFRFWSAVCRAGTIGGPQLAYARDQLARIPLQIHIGLNQLRRNAHFTPLGATLFEDLVLQAAGMEEEAAALDVALETPAWTCRASGALRPVVRDGGAQVLTVRETLLDHLQRCDRRGECAAERDLLASPQ